MDINFCTLTIGVVNIPFKLYQSLKSVNIKPKMNMLSSVISTDLRKRLESF